MIIFNFKPHPLMPVNDLKKSNGSGIPEINNEDMERVKVEESLGPLESESL